MLLFLVNFIRVAIFLVLLYFALKFIGSFFAPKPKQDPYKNKRPEGDTKVYTNNETKSKKYDKTDGEYVDYEEME